MKNKSVRLILSLAALGMLLGGYLGLKVSVSKQEESDEENLEEKKTNVFDVETDAIEALKFTIDDKEVTFDKKDGTWIKKDETDFPVDQDKMSALVSEYSDVESSRSLVNGDDLSAYGLDTPSLIISVTDGNGVVTQLLVGDKVGDEYYLKTADGDTIYTVADTVVSTVSGLTLYDYVKINQLPTVTADQIENITVDAGDKTYVMDAEDSVTSDSTSSGDEINASDTSSTADTDETA